MTPIAETLAQALQHHQAGALVEAEQLYRQILAISPQQVEALHLLGLLTHQMGQSATAVDFITQALRLKSDFAEAHNSLGTIRAEAGNLDEAAACFRRALRLRPDYVDAHNNLANILHQQGKLEEAVASYRQALLLKPDFVEAHFNLGMTLKAQGNLPGAVACYRQAIDQKPGYADGHYNLGIALQEQGYLEEAAACYRRAILHKPAYAEAHNNLANLLKDQGKLDEAFAAYRLAIQLKPSFAEAFNNLGNICAEQGLLDEALAHARRALALKPDFVRAHSNLLLNLCYCPGITLAQLAEAHAEYDRRHAAPFQNAWRPHDNLRDPDRQLRLGFVSPDLGQHPVGFFLVRVLEHLDRRQAEIVCYSNRVVKDEMTARFQAVSALWRDVASWNDDRLAAQIRADRIDILFELAGHGAKSRLLVFARKPAPIQITWAGCMGTTGLTAIDYILADRHEAPREAEAFYSEKVLRMPDGYICYDPPAYAPPVADLPARRRGYVTFGNFNNPAKLNPQVLKLWAKILQRVPTARLLLKYKGMDNPALGERVRGILAGQGIEAERVECQGRSPHPELLAQYNSVDLALDPIPYNGCLTTCEALWMGVPVITCPGETFVGRHSLSHLSALGFTETVAKDLDEYVAIAAALAQDLPRLATLRAGLRQRMAASPLCDGERFATNLLALLRDVWRTWAGQAGPHHADRKASAVDIITPEFAEAQNSLGTVRAGEGKLEEAIACFRRAIFLKPDYAEAHNNLANVFHQQGKLEEAVAGYREALRLKPDLAEAHRNLGMTLRKQGNLAEAVASYQRALRLKPNDVEVHKNLGLAFYEQGNFEEAVANVQRALRSQPDDAEGCNMLGAAFRKQGKLADAVAIYRRALLLQPDFVDAHYNLGIALSAQGKPEEALSCYREAIRLRPDYADAHNNLAITLLLTENFEEGWQEYEWRSKVKTWAPLPAFAQPWWDGSALEGRTILLYSEQGLGDTIQFVRYAPLVKSRGGFVVFACLRPLMRLLARAAGIDRLVTCDGPQAPDSDVYAPLASLPRLLGTTLTSVPADSPYLTPELDLVELWKRRLGSATGLRVGIAWQGNPKHIGDAERSVRLRQFAPLAGLEGVQLISVQKGFGTEQLAEVAGLFAVTDLGPQLDDFADTAAVMANLDLVVTVDSAVAHLAGALGVPVWLVLPFAPDWRWLLHREDSPWYPTIRLFRQKTRGDWPDVFERVTAALRDLQRKP